MEPNACHSLDDVRNEIDRIDDALVDLIAQRNRYIRQAAKFKDSVEKIKEQSRIDSVIERIRLRGIDQGVSANMLEDIFRSMIDEMVETEVAEFRNIKAF